MALDIISYEIGKNSGGGSSINNQNKSVTITENGTTTVTADAGYTGLGTVGITTDVEPDLESKSVTITENTTTTITPSQDKDGLSSVSVTTNVSGGGDVSAYFKETITSGSSSAPGVLDIIKKLPDLQVSASSISSAFRNCHYLTEAPKLTKSSGYVTNAAAAFYGCSSLTDASNLSTLDTSHFTSTSTMFQNCSSLTTINFAMDFTANTNYSSMFSGCSSLTTIGAFTNIGKASNINTAAHTATFTFDVSACPLTHDSLMNIINGLDDLATREIATQDLVLGATNLAKLDASTEVSIATAKGWTVS